MALDPRIQTHKLAMNEKLILNARRHAEITGLVVALLLTTLFWWPAIASRLLPSNLIWRNVAAQAADWFFALILIAIVVFWERRPLSSLGFKPLKWSNFCTGLGLGGFLIDPGAAVNLDFATTPPQLMLAG